MPEMLFNDIFADDAFGFASLTEAVQNLPYVESYLGEIGLFSAMEEGVSTNTVLIDVTDAELKILTTSERGAPPQRGEKEKPAKLYPIKVPHISLEGTTMASELLGKRKPGQNVQQSVVEKINDRFSLMLNNQVAPTMEVHRLGALKGVVLDGDGTTVINDFYDLFGVAQTTFNFALSVSTTPVRERVTALIRTIQDKLGGVSYRGITLLCGRDVFDAFTKHPLVRDTYLQQEGMRLREDLHEIGFEFGGILIKEYRGMRGLPGSIGQIADNEGIAFPTGVMGMFRTYYAPADFLETVDQLGMPMYAKIAPDMKYNRFVDQYIETNPLFINTRPGASIKVTIS